MSDTGDPLPPCSHRPPCPGCPRFGDPGIAPAAREALDALASRVGIPLEAARLGDPRGHRHRARSMVRGRARSPKIGLFQEGSRRIVDTPHCLVHHPRINEAAGALKRAIRATDTAPYADAPHRGRVRALQAVIERESQTVQAVVVTNDVEAVAVRPLLDVFSEELGERLHSLWWNGNPERTNTILGPHWQRLYGPATTRETFGDASVFYPPGAFGQSHLPLADRLVAAIHALVPPGARVAELYAGCGAIGIGLVARGHVVAFNERAPASLEGLALGLDALGDAAKHASVHPGPAGDVASLVADAEIVLVDPPRKGLDPALLAQLAETPPPKLVYVACGRDRFVRDAHALLGEARLRLTRLAPFDLFPFTDHVEILAVFERES